MQSYINRTAEDRPPPPPEEWVETPLLLPSWQCAALERAARGQGMTIGQLLRRLIAAHLRGEHMLIDS